MLESIGLKYNYERLEGKGGVRAFQAPLGNNHAFQGFADRFLVTPRDGIQDHFVTLSGKLSGIQLSAVYHRFLSDADSCVRLRTGFRRRTQLCKSFLVSLKWADYHADPDSFNVTRNVATGQAFDLTRLWVYLQFSY